MNPRLRSPNHRRAGSKKRMRRRLGLSGGLGGLLLALLLALGPGTTHTAARAE
jgi:hypothetical protein